jgi:hypothetical protein
MQSGRAHETQSHRFPEAAAAARSEGLRLPVRKAAFVIETQWLLKKTAREQEAKEDRADGCSLSDQIQHYGGLPRGGLSACCGA